MRNLEDHGATPSDYPSMTNAQRVAASQDTGNLHWVGSNARAASGVLTAGRVGDHVRMYAPTPQQFGPPGSPRDTARPPDHGVEPSYTGPHHNPVLELPLLQDIGWALASTTTTSSTTTSTMPTTSTVSTTTVPSTTTSSTTTSTMPTTTTVTTTSTAPTV